MFNLRWRTEAPLRRRARGHLHWSRVSGGRKLIRLPIVLIQRRRGHAPLDASGHEQR